MWVWGDFLGAGVAMFHGSRVKVSFRHLTRGTSNTLMMGESTGGKDMNYAWMGMNFLPTYWNQADGEPHNPANTDANTGPYAFSSFHSGGISIRAWRWFRSVHFRKHRREYILGHLRDVQQLGQWGFLSILFIEEMPGESESTGLSDSSDAVLLRMWRRWRSCGAGKSVRSARHRGAEAE